jgi:hypothetical protein
MRGALVDGWLGLVCLALASCMGCAATGTIAWGEHAKASLYACPVASPGPTQATLKPVGERTVVTQTFDDKLGFKPQLEETTTVTEPAYPPEQKPVPLAESHGAKVSEGGKNLLLLGLKAIGCVATLGTLCAF